MNKQEALVAILAECRTYEAGHEEVRREDPEVVLRGMLRMAELAQQTPDQEGAREMVLHVAGAALYLLVDEVEIVAGRALDAWLADQKLMSTTIQSWGGEVISVLRVPEGE